MSKITNTPNVTDEQLADGLMPEWEDAIGHYFRLAHDNDGWLVRFKYP